MSTEEDIKQTTNSENTDKLDQYRNTDSLDQDEFVLVELACINKVDLYWLGLSV